MTQLSKKLERLIKKSPEIIPLKVDQGILVGSILIKSEGSIKNLYKKDLLMYENIHLNKAAIRMANLLAKNLDFLKIAEIYKADREYGKWFQDSQILRSQHQKAVSNRDYDRADVLWARYCESRDKALKAKIRVEALCIF